MHFSQKTGQSLLSVLEEDVLGRTSEIPFLSWDWKRVLCARTSDSYTASLSLSVLSLDLLLVMCVCVWVCVHTLECSCSQRPEGVLALQVVVNHPLWITDTKYGSFARAVIFLTAEPSLQPGRLNFSLVF